MQATKVGWISNVVIGLDDVSPSFLREKSTNSRGGPGRFSSDISDGRYLLRLLKISFEFQKINVIETIQRHIKVPAQTNSYSN